MKVFPQTPGDAYRLPPHPPPPRAFFRCASNHRVRGRRGRVQGVQEGSDPLRYRIPHAAGSLRALPPARGGFRQAPEGLRPPHNPRLRRPPLAPPLRVVVVPGGGGDQVNVPPDDPAPISTSVGPQILDPIGEAFGRFDQEDVPVVGVPAFRRDVRGVPGGGQIGGEAGRQSDRRPFVHDRMTVSDDGAEVGLRRGGAAVSPEGQSVPPPQPRVGVSTAVRRKEGRMDQGADPGETTEMAHSSSILSFLRIDDSDARSVVVFVVVVLRVFEEVHRNDEGVPGQRRRVVTAVVSVFRGPRRAAVQMIRFERAAAGAEVELPAAEDFHPLQGLGEERSGFHIDAMV
mmetsp:Transcript_43836/g.133466  ORF Transcript_43836/g.133466 Transcript_43836/m.133466 type:complete len:344 (-) Transcript_43836:28-1059(-)